jgi:hypothetical protein
MVTTPANTGTGNTANTANTGTGNTAKSTFKSSGLTDTFHDVHVKPFAATR